MRSHTFANSGSPGPASRPRSASVTTTPSAFFLPLSALLIAHVSSLTLAVASVVIALVLFISNHLSLFTASATSARNSSRLWFGSVATMSVTRAMKFSKASLACADATYRARCATCVTSVVKSEILSRSSCRRGSTDLGGTGGTSSFTVSAISRRKARKSSMCFNPSSRLSACIASVIDCPKFGKA